MTETSAWLDLYEGMVRIRRFEEKAIELFERGLIRGNVHPCIGQEAVSVGVCAGLQRGDYMTSTHRGHGNCLAKGADPRIMMAELLGRRTGYCKGKGGSMHIADFEGGNLGANGIVGGGFPIAAGAGIGIQNRGTDQVVVCFFGDGAANQGTFHESLNLAALWKLPVLYVCENNQYAMGPALARSEAQIDLTRKAAGYGLPTAHINGMNVLAVHEAAKDAVARVRAAQAPFFLELHT